MTTVTLEEPGSTRDSFSGGSTLGFADSLNNNKSSREDDKCLLAGIGLVALITVAAIVLAAIAISENDSTPTVNVGSMPSGSSSAGSAAQAPIVISAGGAGGAAGPGGRRIYTLVIGHDYGAHEYLDEEGYLAGFARDLMTAVCEAAGVDCRIVWDKTTNCWYSTPGEHSMGGQGLFDRWYDGCMGWDKSVNRIQTFAFSTSYFKRDPSSFYIKKGNSFDSKDITGKKIGFVDGWVYDEKCIARQTDIKGHTLPLDKIAHFPDPETAANALLNGDVDALSGDDTVFKQWVDQGQFDKSGEFYCTISGAGVMARKDSDFLNYWNQGFAKIQSSGKFKQVCQDAIKKHGSKGLINCV